MDVFEAAYSFQDAEMVKAAGVYPYFQPLEGSDGPVVNLHGKPVVMLGSNNYLGLTHHPEVKKAAHEAIDKYGTGCTGSRFLNGNLDLHQTLEAELAEFTGKEAALVFASGFLANLGTVGLLGSLDGVEVFSDKENHASLIDGVRMSRKKPHIFKDLDDLEAQLSAKPSWPEALVVTDAVFSMTGRVFDVKRLVELKRQYGFRIYLDDAHGFGVMGSQGRGVADAQGVNGEIDLLFATFSKSMASLGGFVAGEKAVIEFLKHKVRTQMFSAALPPASTASALAALRVMRKDQALFTRLWENVKFFREGVEKLGYFTMGSNTPIVPLFVGSESMAFRMCKDALELGVFATPAVSPAVPLGQGLIRTSVTPAHTKEHLQKGLDVFAALAERYPIPKVKSLGELPVADAMDFTYLFPQEAA